MPWSSQGGGGQGPWGGGSGGGSGGGPQPPDFEELLRKGQASVKRFMPSGLGGVPVLIVAVVAALAIWGFTGFYRVQPGEKGVELLFGKFV